jgi:hypothetical protein
MAYWAIRRNPVRVIARSILHQIKGCDRAPQFEQLEVIAQHILAFGRADHLSGSPRLA